MRIKPLLIAALAVAGTACGLDKQTAPSLSGPAAFGVSVTLTASPDVLTQDGSSTSTIQVAVTDANNQPISNLNLRADTFIGGSEVTFGSLSASQVTTNSTGHASIVYTSPAPPSANATQDVVVTLAFTPVGSDFASAAPHSVAIRLARPNPTASTSDLLPAFTFAPGAPLVGDNVSFDASTSKIGAGRSIISYIWTFSDGGVTSGKQGSHVFPHAGASVATLTVTDDIGRVASATAVVTVGSNLPTANFVFSPTTPTPGEHVVFNAAVSKPGTGRAIVAYAWDFGDGGTSATGPTTTHTFGAQGTYSVVLTVTDDMGQSATTTQAVTVGTAVAVASFTFSQASAGASVLFDASASTPSAGATIVTYDWDFGDGSAHGSTKTLSHSYTPGTYAVVLTITDSSGKTASRSISVTAN